MSPQFTDSVALDWYWDRDAGVFERNANRQPRYTNLSLKVGK